MAGPGVLRGCRCEEGDVALCEVDECVEDGRFRAVESGCSEHVDDGWSEESAMEIVCLRHFRDCVKVQALPQDHVRCCGQL